MNRAWLVVTVSLLVVGCASLSNRFPTRPPAGRATDAVMADEKACESYARAQPKHHGDHYVACMVSRSHAANVDMEHLGWTIGLTQTRPHDTATVAKDLAHCDSLADNVKAAQMRGLPPADDAQRRREAFSAAVAATDGTSWGQRLNAVRMLAMCLTERGYALVPWVRMSELR